MSDAMNQLERGIELYEEGKSRDAIALLTQVIESNDSSATLLGRALLARSQCHEELREPVLVINDLMAAAARGILSLRVVARSLHNYGVRCNLNGLKDKACTYFSAVAEIPEAGCWVRTNAIVNRGSYYGQNARYNLAIKDFHTALEVRNIPADVRARGLYNLANAVRLNENHADAVALFTRVTELEKVPNITLAAAFAYRGQCLVTLGEFDRALKDFEQALRVPGAQAEDVAFAALWTGICLDEQGKHDQAIEHFKRLEQSEAASVEMRARAKWGRAEALAKLGDSRQARQELLKAQSTFRQINRADLAEKIGRLLAKIDETSES